MNEKLKSTKELTPTMMNLHEFLYHHTPSDSTWVILDGGYRVAIFYIDDEDLWSGWFPSQCMNCKVKAHTYDEKTKTGRIEIE